MKEKDKKIEGTNEFYPYIGTKIIRARECTKEKPFLNPRTDEVYTHGYALIYHNPDGSTYYSWSPKDVFESSYRKVSAPEKSLIIEDED